jgi:competence protein ComEC
VVVVLGGKMLDRPLRLVDSLAFAAIVILIWRPQDLFDPSFQLSFVAALTLALRPAPTALALARSKVKRWLGRGLATSAWVSLATAPITALHFHQVAAGGVIGNLLLTPLVELVALPLGFAGVLVGEVWTAGGAALIEVGVWIVGRVDEIAAVLAKVVPVGSVALASPLLVIVLVSVTLWLAARKQRSRADAIAWLALCLMWGLGRVPAPTGTLRVTFLDVGQGDAAIVETPGGHVWLVDAGGVASARTLEGASAPGRAITRTLEVYGHDAIDLAIVSHPHPDHYLGLMALDLPVRELWFVDEPPIEGAVVNGAGARESLPSFRVIARALEMRGTIVGRPALGTVRTDDGVELTVWAPRWQAAEGAAVELGADPVRSVNDNSLVVAVSYGGRTILFAGDLEAEGEEALVAAGVERVAVVKVAHHGSPTSSSAAFVEATAPEVAVISCGVANAFGFPSEDVLARWRGVGARVQRTDLDGAVTVTVGISGALGVSRFAP